MVCQSNLCAKETYLYLNKFEAFTYKTIDILMSPILFSHNIMTICPIVYMFIVQYIKNHITSYKNEHFLWQDHEERWFRKLPKQ